MPIPLRRARTFATALTLVLLTALGTRQAHAVDAVSKGYEETISQNTHGLGISFGVGGLNGIAYRHYFGNLALQVDLFPLIADSGNYVAVFGGVTFIDYLLMWNRAARNTLFPATSALRFVGSTGVWVSRNQSNNYTVPSANCNTPECQAINSRSAPVDYFAHVGLGIGVEMGAIARPGFSAAFDVQMTVMWDQAGFYGAYPLPSATLMYSW